MNVLTKADYKKIIDTYKEQNPAKYEAKKAVLEEKMKNAPAK